MTTLHASRFEYQDEAELLDDYHARGWTDGLPVVAPTPERVEAFLAAAGLVPEAVLGEVRTRQVVVTAEHVAINAVMAGCRADYMPVVVAAVRAHLSEMGNCHSTTGTLSGAAQVVIVNGPARTELDVNCLAGCFGPGWRANATIGRALQLVIRNVGGGKPGGVDRSTLGNPGKLGFCFAENEEDSCWEPLSVERGVAPGKSAVTVFAGAGVRGVVDDKSRTPESLARSFAACLLGSLHPKAFGGLDGIVVVSPEHQRVFREAGWSKQRLIEELHALTTVPAEEVLVNAGGIAGLFSAILDGWSPSSSSRITTKEVRD
jgi:hypothetical protein